MTTLKRQAEEMAWEIKGDMGQPEEEYYELIQAFLAGAEAGFTAGRIKLGVVAEDHSPPNKYRNFNDWAKDGGESES